jgi:hypothetical protein
MIWIRIGARQSYQKRESAAAGKLILVNLIFDGLCQFNSAQLRPSPLRRHDSTRPTRASTTSKKNLAQLNSTSLNARHLKTTQTQL